MKIINYPYVRYGYATLIVRKELSPDSEITAQLLKECIEQELSYFRMFPKEIQKEYAWFGYDRIERGNPADGIYLSSHVMTTDAQAGNAWRKVHEYLDTLSGKDADTSLEKMKDIGMANIPLAGEFLTFGATDTGRGNGKMSVQEQSFGIITTLTPLKPALQIDNENYCIIPDIPLEKLVDFITLFDKMYKDSLKTDVCKGKTDERGRLFRPAIYGGNFPSAPRSRRMGAIALLGAIGAYTFREEVSELARSVLDSLRGSILYMIKYGQAIPFTYNHYVIELAKEDRLYEIVDKIYYSRLYRNRNRGKAKDDYDRFDFFAGRFLQLFNRPSFLDFLSHRAEYPFELKKLFQTYFTKMEKIGTELVASAQAFGRWLNHIAYISAKEEVGNTDSDAFYTAKAKNLVMMESSIYAAKSGDALIAQVLTLVGRMSKNDAPAESALFMEKTITGQIELSVAKNLLIAYSRLCAKKKVKNADETEFEEMETENNENMSNE